MSLDVNYRGKRGPFMFIGIVALVSLGLAYGLFWLVSSGTMNFGTTNHGKFVEPRTLANSISLLDEKGTGFDTGGYWSLWLVTDGACEVRCRQRLEELRKLHILLNRDASRVRRYLLAPHIQSLEREVAQNNPRLKIFLRMEVNQLTAGVYIVDPLSQLVLHYDEGVEIAHLLEDLKRLLKVSQIG